MHPPTMLNPLWAEGAVRTTFEWGRIQSNADWILPISVCIAVLLFVRWMYRRDSVELQPIWRWILTALRTAAFLGLLLLYLQPHWRTEREDVLDSRVLVLVDTSLSMGTPDGESEDVPMLRRELHSPRLQNTGGSSATAAPTAASNPTSVSRTRSQQVIQAFQESDFFARLQKVHDVTVIPFSEDIKRDAAITLDKIHAAKPGDETRAPDENNQTATPPAPPDWKKLLAPIGLETRIGQSLRQVIQEERGTPISGIILFSDGGQNAGIAPSAAVELAQEAKIPIFTVGLGSDRPPTNAAVCDFTVPARAYPGDRYTVTGYVQAQGMAGKTATAQVLSREAGEGHGKQGYGDPIETQQITLGGDGEVLPVKFELTPDAVGRHTLCFRILPPPDDQNPNDNMREADIEIVTRKNRVLLMANGPTRDYQFLRNQLYRDRYTKVDVLLQSGKPGISQEANKILDEFPATREAMFEYDCVVAFDPDWKLLNASQIAVLEKWVGEQGGGLIVIPGPVEAGKGVDGWIQDPSMTMIRNLYPVDFFGRLGATESNMYSSAEPWPVEFTREGLSADFLGLADTAVDSNEAWKSFHGVYSYYPVRGPKPGATVYARFSDPRVLQNNEGPIYFAGQFYGAGQVFYLGSAEIWRLRELNENYFVQFYTKLIRHVAQGRLLRGSSRGVLLVGQDRYMLGNTVEVHAQLTNARLEPLESATVNAQLVQPDGAMQTIVLRADPSRLGAFLGQFSALQEGTYRLDLAVPESENEHLSRRVQVKVPDLERENPRRNDAVLSTIAKGTGGKYYIGIGAALAPQQGVPLVEELKDRTSKVIRPETPDPKKEEGRLRWMMNVLCGLLCLEWLIRRLLKLA